MQNFEENALPKIPRCTTNGKKVICEKQFKTLKASKIHLKQEDNAFNTSVLR